MGSCLDAIRRMSRQTMYTFLYVHEHINVKCTIAIWTASMILQDLNCSVEAIKCTNSQMIEVVFIIKIPSNSLLRYCEFLHIGAA